MQYSLKHKFEGKTHAKHVGGAIHFHLICKLK